MKYSIALIILSACSHLERVQAKNGIEFEPDVHIKEVQELCLEGDADASVWTPILEQENLHPWIVNPGRVKILICGTNASFQGISFSEMLLSISVLESDAKEGYFLAQAWNSRRLFAWIEQVHNHSPYLAGEINVTLASLLEIKREDKSLIRAVKKSELPYEYLGSTEFAGLLHLPEKDGIRHQCPIFLQGRLERTPFIPEVDALEITAPSEDPEPQERMTLEALKNSHFTPHFWLVQTNAVHAKGPIITKP